MARLRSYETDSGLTSLPLTVTAKKFQEDKIFERQDILQFLSQGFKYYKSCKIPNHDIWHFKPGSHLSKGS